MSLFGGSSSASSDPFAAFAAMQQAQAAGQQAALGADWLNFAKQQYADSLPRQQALDDLTSKVTQSQLAAQDQANTWASEDRARYKSIFQPLQDQYIAKTSNWDSAANQDKVAAEAKADVLSNAAAQKAANERALAARGINPTSGAYAGIERAAASRTALDAAGAENNARNQLRTQAVGLQGDALNVGAGLPSQALSAQGQGIGAGSSASGVALGAEGNFRSNLGIMNSAYAGAGSLYGQAGSAWGNIYNSRTSLLNQQAQQDAAGQNALLGGIGSAVGLGYGIYKSDENAKEEKREVRGILDALKKIPVEAWKYKEGEGDGDEHVGPYAQDFKKATGLGDGKNINVIDALGVTMGAVKELAEKVETLKGGKDGDEKPSRARAPSRPQSKSIMRKEA